MNRTGRWYLTLMNVSLSLTDKDIADGKIIPKELILPFTSSYNLRTWTSGCYFYEENTRAWISTGMQIREVMYEATNCRSDHLTAFANGFFFISNDFDFDFVFANASFEDNLTVYALLIVTLILYLLLTMWAR